MGTEFGKLRSIVEDKLTAAGVQDFMQNAPYHFGSFYDHIAATAEYITENADVLPLQNKEALLNAIYYHDMAKDPNQAQPNPKTGYLSFLGHEEKSAERYREYKAINSEGLLPDNIEYASELIRLHGAQPSKQGKCQAILNDHPNGFAADLIAIQLADTMGMSEYQRTTRLDNLIKFASRLKEVGTPEQTVGLDEFIKIINKEKEQAHDLNLTETRIDDGKEVKDTWFARTDGGENIYIEDGLAEHLQVHHIDPAHIVEAVGHMEFSGSPDGNFAKQATSIDLGRIVGVSDLKTLTPEDKPLRLCRKGRNCLSNVILDGKGDETSKVFVVAGYIPDAKKSLLFTAAYGDAAPKEPGDPTIKTDEERQESEEFWKTHALCVSYDDIDWEKTKELLEAEKAKEAVIGKIQAIIDAEKGKEDPAKTERDTK